MTETEKQNILDAITYSRAGQFAVALRYAECYPVDARPNEIKAFEVGGWAHPGSASLTTEGYDLLREFLAERHPAY